MTRGILFWAFIAALFGASVFFAVGAEQQRRGLQEAEASLKSGDLVSLAQVVDGDTVVVSTEGGEKASVRLLGVKAFDAKREKDPTEVYGQGAIDGLRRMLEGKPIRVMLHSTSKDKYGRVIATLFVEERDAALELVKGGLLLVYTVYPFPAMPLYLHEQEIARADRRGLWASPEAAARADALALEWRRQVP
jgi:endonuclease YncB( thermonuclease family)